MIRADATTLATGLRFPEGPAFDGNGALWGVELEGGALFRWRNAAIERVPVGGRPNGLAFDRAGRAWFCDSGLMAVRRLDGAVAASIVVGSPQQPLAKPNDLAFDGAGNLVFTCPGDSRQEPTGSVWCRRHDGTSTLLRSGLYFPNGLAFGDDGRTLVVAETYRHRLWRGAWDASTATWSDAQPWVTVGGPVGPDGMAFGTDGHLYVAVFGQGRIAIVDPAGTVAGAIATPGARPTNVAFDPSGTLGLVVTEAEHGALLSFPDVGRGIGNR